MVCGVCVGVCGVCVVCGGVVWWCVVVCGGGVVVVWWVWWCVVVCGGVWCVCVCGVVWCGVVWCGVVWCVVWCGVVWCGVGVVWSVVWCGVVWWCGVVCGVVWCGVVWCGVVWCGVVWCGVCGVVCVVCVCVCGVCVVWCVVCVWWCVCGVCGGVCVCVCVVLAKGMRRCLPMNELPTESFILQVTTTNLTNLTCFQSHGVLVIALQKRTSVPVSTQDFRIFPTTSRAPQGDSSAADEFPSFTSISELQVVDAPLSRSLGSCIIWKNQSIESLSIGFRKTAKWHVCDMFALLQ